MEHRNNIDYCRKRTGKKGMTSEVVTGLGMTCQLYETRTCGLKSNNCDKTTEYKTDDKIIKRLESVMDMMLKSHSQTGRNERNFLETKVYMNFHDEMI